MAFADRWAAQQWFDLTLWWTNFTEAKYTRPYHSPISTMAKDVGLKIQNVVVYFSLRCPPQTMTIPDKVDVITRLCGVELLNTCVLYFAASLQLCLDTKGVANLQSRMFCFLFNKHDNTFLRNCWSIFAVHIYYLCFILHTKTFFMISVFAS